ncbi:hypothetical protein BGZ51_009415 [Haplosporangium sp. Z 767]|nr:hypothetical protein BGZ50_009507 [Haplosporangium sp. Z 11]KAF9176913.1 hypothetical protein BGZ51_009415 [Haplosporangium sp. Z 767]
MPVALWNTQLVATMCDKYELLDERKTTTTIMPVLDPESDMKATLYTNAITGCEREIRSIKRSLKRFACT